MATGLLFGAALGSSVGCLLQLDPEVSCGDGWVDREAGEECDPEDPDRAFERACDEIGRPMGTAGCDPLTCRIDKSFETCAVCGDGVIDVRAGEECEGSDLASHVCPGGAGFLQCTGCKLDDSACEHCGNGIAEPEMGEECDPGDTLNLATQRPCAGDETTPGIPSPFSDPPKPYASGTYQGCEDDCRWTRSVCSYCGDGFVDGKLLLDASGEIVYAAPEECDGDAFSKASVEASDAWAECTAIEDSQSPGDVLEGVRPNLACDSFCSVQDIAKADEPCCVESERACPYPGTPYAEAGLACCWSYLHPDEIEAGTSPCENVLTQGKIGLEVCR